eukprot:TRINITY_DN1269_c0_g2_i1.p1 TRINITY_DN1269_c0_g2~~TRINITY_DN1269_c0_g2_i1.p1  ORF type:complete len:223 (+),score=28.80 TRINITY_DN1269_c0_g2_i1:78-746(+)
MHKFLHNGWYRGHNIFRWAKIATKNELIKRPRWLPTQEEQFIPTSNLRAPHRKRVKIILDEDRLTDAYYLRFPEHRERYSFYPSKYDNVYQHPMRKFVSRWRELIEKGINKKKAFRITLKERKIEEDGKEIAKELATQQAEMLYNKKIKPVEDRLKEYQTLYQKAYAKASEIKSIQRKNKLAFICRLKRNSGDRDSRVKISPEDIPDIPIKVKFKQHSHSNN